jgi:beta-phosphoglucomutase
MQFDTARFKAAIFDLDGVIVDTAKYHFVAWRKLANELGGDFTEHQNEQLKGVSRMQSLELILQWTGVSLTPQEKLDWAEWKNDQYLVLIENMTPDEILPGADTFLQQLRAAGIKVGLGSASKNAPMILEKIGMIQLFDTIVDGNTVSAPKPDPEVFLTAAANLGLAATDCVVFEDAQKGVEAAKNGGFYCIGIGDAATLTLADQVVNGLYELL